MGPGMKHKKKSGMYDKLKTQYCLHRWQFLPYSIVVSEYGENLFVDKKGKLTELMYYTANARFHFGFGRFGHILFLWKNGETIQ